MDGNVDIRITPLSNVVKSRPKSTQELNHSRFITAKKLKQPTQATPLTKKKIAKNHLLVLSKKGINKPTLSVKTFSNRIQAPALADKKGVLLYRQIENNKLLHGAELANRFNYKV